LRGEGEVEGTSSNLEKPQGADERREPPGENEPDRGEESKTGSKLLGKDLQLPQSLRGEASGTKGGGEIKTEVADWSIL